MVCSILNGLMVFIGWPTGYSLYFWSIFSMPSFEMKVACALSRMSICSAVQALVSSARL